MGARVELEVHKESQESVSQINAKEAEERSIKFAPGGNQVTVTRISLHSYWPLIHEPHSQLCAAQWYSCPNVSNTFLCCCFCSTMSLTVWLTYPPSLFQNYSYNNLSLLKTKQVASLESPMNKFPKTILM